MTWYNVTVMSADGMTGEGPVAVEADDEEAAKRLFLENSLTVTPEQIEEFKLTTWVVEEIE